MERYGIYMDSVEAKSNKLKATLESIWTKTINSGTIKTILDISNALLSVIDNIGGLDVALMGLVGTLLIFNTVKIVDGIGTIGASITKLIGTITSATSALTGLGVASGAATGVGAVAGATGLLGGLTAALPVVGAVLVTLATGFGIYNAVVEANRRRLEEATEATNAYIERVESIPTKLTKAQDAVEEINKGLTIRAEGKLTDEGASELQAYLDTLHTLVPEYEGWHYSKMGWYLEEQVELEKILELIRAQGTMTPEEQKAFEKVFESENEKFEDVFKERGEQKAVDYIREYLSEQEGNKKDALLELMYSLEDRWSTLTDFEKSLYNKLVEITSYGLPDPILGEGADIADDIISLWLGDPQELEVAAVEKEQELEKIAQGLLDKWVGVGDEFREALRTKFGEDNPLVTMLDSLMNNEGIVANAGDGIEGVAEEFETFNEVLQGISATLSGDAKSAFDEFAGQISGLNKMFEDGKISTSSYFESLTTLTKSSDLKTMFQDDTDAAQKFFATLVSQGAEAFNSLNSQFSEGKINIDSYMEGIVGTNQMLIEQLDMMKENADTFGITNEQLAEYDSQIREISNSTASSIQELGQLQPTVDLLLAGFGDTMSGTLAQGSENWVSYMSELSNAAWATSQDIGSAFTDLNGNMLGSAEEIYAFLSGGVGNFNHFANQMANNVSGFVNKAVKTTADGMRLLSEVTSSFEMIVTPKVTDTAATMTFQIPIFDGTNMTFAPMSVPIPGFTLTGTGKTTTSVPYTPVDYDSSIFLPPSGGGYTPPSSGGGGGGGGRDPNEERNNAEKAYQDLLAMTIKMLKDKAEQEKKALKEQLDAYKAIIDARKKDLDAQKERRAWENKERDAIDEIADLQAELLQLQFDTSEEGIARRLELEAELAKRQADLEDDRFNESIDRQKDLLDEDYEAYKKNIEDKIKELDDYLSRSGDIAQEAMELIQERSDEFYEELMNWNLTYGSGIAEDVISAWQGAITWIDTYAMGAVQALEATAGAATAAGSALASMGEQAKSGLENYAAGLDALVEAIKRYRSIVQGIGSGSYHPDAPVETPFHEGGTVGGVPRLPETEVYAKLLKGEHVSTEEQQVNFIRKTLPNLMASGVSGGGYNLDVSMPITVNGSLDRASAPLVGEAVANALVSIMRDNGIPKQID